MDKVAMDDRVAITPCDRYEEEAVDSAIDRVVSLLGGWKTVVAPELRTYIKPNLAGPFAPDRAVTTHPLVVKSVARRLKAEGLDLIIGDSPAGPSSEFYQRVLYRRTGIKSVAEELGIPLDFDGVAQEVELQNPRVIRRLTLLRSVATSAQVINLPKFKTHLFVRMTGGIKNLFGAVPGFMKIAYHSRHQDPETFSALLLDLADWIRPALTVVDAITGMEGDGPTWGKPRTVGYIIAGVNPLAIDLVISQMMGLTADQVPLFRWVSPPTVEVVGVPVKVARVKGFVLPRPSSIQDGLDALVWIPKGLRDRFGRSLLFRPRVDKRRCTGCCRCQEACPKGAISLERGRAVMDDHRCIRCWCCHEVCPHAAVFLEQPFLGRVLAPLQSKDSRILRRCE